VKTLVLAAHVDPRVASSSFRAALPPEVEICAFVEPGLSSAYHALAVRLRANGRVLPALLDHVGTEHGLESYDRVIFLSWSAPYALAEEILASAEDAAALSGWVALDSGYGQPTMGVVDLARRARAGTALYWAGFTDVPTAGYLSSGAFLAEVERLAGEPGGLFHVEHWRHDPAALASAPNQSAFWRSEHIGAVHRGPAFLASALAALDAAAPLPSPPLDNRAAVLALARAALAAGVREAPPGSNRGPEVDAYLRGCVRRGRPLGVLGVPWCAAFASWCIWRAAYGEEAATRAIVWTWRSHVGSPQRPAIGWRAAVSELCADALGTGRWQDWDEGARPEPGDVLVMGRQGQDPRHGGEGHAAIVDEAAEGGGFYAIGGNESDAVRRTLRGAATDADEQEPIVGFIDLGM
jgi:hypothetical protein